MAHLTRWGYFSPDVKKLLDPIPSLGHGTMEESSGKCHAARCEWIHLHNITGLTGVPPLRPNPELSGIGVVLGFSLTAYLTLILLILHYITVHDYRRTNSKGKQHINSVDQSLLTFVRDRLFSWKPSRRFEFAMEKAVLILSDTQLVSGLAILVSGYSQLDCGITAYHWQVMVYVAWFSSFSFLSAMTFLEGYFQTNSSLRIIRVCFMVLLASLLIAALLPTGSHDWLNLLPWESSFFPSLDAVCYYRQMGMLDFNTHKGPKLWSMVVSILLVGLSYIHSAIRLFDPTAEVTRKYLRIFPGSRLKHLLHILEQKSNRKGIRACIWTPFYLFFYAAFVNARAIYDIAESMLFEIIWLSFAVAWGSIKLYDTRKSAGYNQKAEWVDANPDVTEENSWSFGQILPLVLLLLPILCMTQAYLDNDAKAADAAYRTAQVEKAGKERSEHFEPVGMTCVQINNKGAPSNTICDLRSVTSCDVVRYNHHPSIQHTETQVDCGSPASPTQSDTWGTNTSVSKADTELGTASCMQPLHSSTPSDSILPQHPYRSFSHYDWYDDQVFLLLLQILVVTSFALFLLGYQGASNFLGLSVFFRNRMFLGWILAIIPAASLCHNIAWYVGARIARRFGWTEWLMGQNRRGEVKWWKTVRGGYVVYFLLRMSLVCGLVVATYFVSFDIAGPDPLTFFL